jgi:hypothetical protein
VNGAQFIRVFFVLLLARDQQRQVNTVTHTAIFSNWLHELKLEIVADGRVHELRSVTRGGRMGENGSVEEDAVARLPSFLTKNRTLT